MFELQPELVANPYPVYHRLQREAPVFVYGPSVVLTRHEHLVAAFKDHNRFATGLSGSRIEATLRLLPESEAQLFIELNEFEKLWMSNRNGTDHTRLRTLAHLAFTPRRVAEMREGIQQLTDKLLDDMQAAANPDVVSGLARPLPLMVINEMLDVPENAWGLVASWTAALASQRESYVTLRSDLRHVHRSMTEFRAYVGELIAKRRSSSGSDLLAALLKAEAAGDRLSEDELFAMLVLLLLGGHETTANLIGNGLLALLQSPEQWALLRENPSLVTNCVEELLRFDSPVQFTPRVLMDRVEVAGTLLDAGQSVLLALGAANHDAAVYEKPDDLDIRRARASDLGFGLGPHFCLGASLARLEAEVVLSSLVRRFPNMQLANAKPEWRANLVVRGLQRLPVILNA